MVGVILRGAGPSEGTDSESLIRSVVKRRKNKKAGKCPTFYSVDIKKRNKNGFRWKGVSEENC